MENRKYTNICFVNKEPEAKVFMDHNIIIQINPGTFTVLKSRFFECGKEMPISELGNYIKDIVTTQSRERDQFIETYRAEEARFGNG